MNKCRKTTGGEKNSKSTRRTTLGGGKHSMNASKTTIGGGKHNMNLSKTATSDGKHSTNTSRTSRVSDPHGFNMDPDPDIYYNASSFSLQCGSGSCSSSSRWCEFATTGLETVHWHPFCASTPRFDRPRPSLALFWARQLLNFDSMRIRIKLFTLMRIRDRIRIQLPKTPDMKPWEQQYEADRTNTVYKSTKKNWIGLLS